MQHIPQGETRELELLPFDDALRLAQEPAPDYDVSRWLYVPKVYSEYRYILGTRGNNTLKSVERIALANGFDSFLMFNVYAQRATDPDSMERRCNERLHQENLRAFQYLLSLSPQPAVWAAWGAIIEKRDYLAVCLSDQIALGQRAGARWFTAGPISKKGHPHHPLYLRKDAPLNPFDPELYCQNILKVPVTAK